MINKKLTLIFIILIICSAPVMPAKNKHTNKINKITCIDYDNTNIRNKDDISYFIESYVEFNFHKKTIKLLDKCIGKKFLIERYCQKNKPAAKIIYCKNNCENNACILDSGWTRCEEVPEICPTFFKPVCDIYGVTHQNKCNACLKPNNIYKQGECEITGIGRL